MTGLTGTAASAAGMSRITAYAFTFKGLDGGEILLSSFAGHPLLVVNTASLCGYTPQYAGLQELWTRYRGRGLIVLGVPSNDFGGQEPGSNAEIKKFCEGNYDVDFPLTTKYDVKGDTAHPFYKWAAATGGDAAVPKWNFHKLLIGPNGQLVSEWPSKVTPDSSAVETAIEAQLAAKG